MISAPVTSVGPNRRAISRSASNASTIPAAPSDITRWVELRHNLFRNRPMGGGS